MAEVVLFDLAKKVLDVLESLALQEIKLARGVKDELENLKSTISTIQAVLLDAEKQGSSNNEVKDWLKKLRDVFLDVGDLLDDFSTEALQHKVMAGNKMTKEEDGIGTKLSDQVADKNLLETDSSTSALYNSDKDKLRSKKMKMKMEKKKRRRREELEIAESIRWLAEVMVRSEQTRMDTMREIERMKVEAEAKRGEVDLRRTEILLNCQLEIARLFAGIGKGVNFSLRSGEVEMIIKS